MPDELEVHLNREEPHSIEVATPSFKADDSFDIVLNNHGTSLHVYLQLDDDLSRAARLETANQYVNGEMSERVRVNVDESAAPADGKLKVVTGYGARSAYVTVRVVEPEARKKPVEVDETLSKPKQTATQEREPLIDTDNLSVVILGGIALTVALLASIIVGGDLALVGLLIVFVGVAIAAALLLQ